MSTRLNIIRRLLVSEKHSERAAEDSASPSGPRLYVFEVDIRANKIEIKLAFMEAFELQAGDIRGLRTLIRPGKPKRRGRMRKGWRPDRKLAFLTVNRDIYQIQQV
ncbi:MAG: 50S ribosomal protein L23 [Deltaproteobacteria bacterium]|jgi:large subunit ribosomal protein L23|nr:50S ribosomal protein L23 [Deltaproteobacteria bacterium]